MCQELNEELDRGKNLAQELAQHLRGMGAAQCVIPVLIEDEKYEITVKHIPVTEEK